MNARLIRQAIRAALALLFIAAAVPKIFAPTDFALALFRYRLLPPATINAFALTLPWLEALSAAALLHRRWRAAGAFWLAALLVAGAAAMASARIQGLAIDCGCFSVRPGAEPITAASFVRNAALLALLVWSARDGDKAAAPEATA